MGRETSDLKKRTGAELRALAEQRLASDPKSMAERHEALFLKGIGSMQAEFDWLIEHAAWLDLGFESVAEWWDQRVRPALVTMEMRPTPEMVDKILTAVRAAERALPAAQRRTQRELASLTLASDWKVRGRIDSRNRRSAAGDDLDVPSDHPKTDPDQNASNDSGAAGSAAGAAVADPPVPAAPQAHPVAIPGEAEDEGPEGGESSGVDDVGTSATQTEPERSAPVDPSGSVDGRERPEVPGVSAPAALVPVPSWLVAITNVITAVHDLDEEDPQNAAYGADDDLSAELGSAVSMLTKWYRQMQEAKS